MKILIDNGHGRETAGKRSPDGRLMEWKYTREIAQAVRDELTAKGYDVVLLTPEDTDVTLNARVKRANEIVRRDKGGALLVSIHCNASGSDGEWHTPNGWSAHVALNASANSKRLARCFSASARGARIRVRTPDPHTDYWAQNLAICRDTLCPAVLTENLFQDNRADVDFLLSEAGRKAIIRLHVEGIINYIRGL